MTPRPSGGSATTTTFGGNLTLSSAAANFTLDTTAAGSNDKVVYGNSGSGTLTLGSSDTINITCTSLQQADYTLFSTTSGTLSMTTIPTLKTNGVTVTPAVNSFIITNTGNNVVLHYLQAATPATVTAQTASPSTIAHHGTTLITVSATAASGDSISSVTVVGDGLAGAGDPTSLISDGSGNWTNTFTAAASLTVGGHIVSGSVVESSGAVAPWTVTVNVVNTNTTWSGSGSDNKWSTVNNWNFGLSPGPGDNISFSGTTQLTNNLDASLSVSSLTFNSGAGSFDITNAASTLTLAGSLTNNSASAQTLDVPVALSGAQTINAASGNVTINYPVSDSGAGITLAGTGTLALSAANTYSGPTTISGGLLAITGSGSLGSGSYSAGITDNGALNYGSSASQTLSGTISGTGSLTNSGSGKLTLNGTNTYSGGTTLNAGTIVFGNSSAFGTNVVTANGGTLNCSFVAGNANFTNNVVVNGPVTFEAAVGNWNFNGNLTGSGTITRGSLGLDSLYLGGDNSGFTGTYQDQSTGTSVTRFSANTAGSTNAHWIFNQTVQGRTSLPAVSGTIHFGSFSGTGSLSDGGSGILNTVEVGALGLNDTFSGVIVTFSGNIAFTKVGAGTMTLSGVNTYSGATAINAGELVGQTGGSCSNSAVTVAVGATNGVKVATANGQWSCTNLTYSSGGTSYSDFDFGSVVPSTTSAPLNVLNNLTNNGTAQIIVRNGTGFTAGQVYPLISWTGAGPTNLISFAKPILPGGVIGTLSLGSQSINLNAGIYVPNLFFTNAPGIARIISVSDITAAGLTSAQGSPNYTVTVGTPINGGAVFTNASGTMMKYTNSPSFSASSDSFIYTVSDGTSSATATVSITMASVTGSQLATAGTDGNGHAVINFYAIPNYTYHMQHASTLGPPPDWTNLLNAITVPANGSVTWTNLESPAAGFYRLSYP